MKTIYSTVLLLLIAVLTNAQTWVGSNTTYNSGTYGPLNTGAVITIADGANVTFTQLQVSSGSFIIGNNATLFIDKLVGTFSAPLTINGTGYVEIKGNAIFNNAVLLSNNSKLIVTGNFTQSGAAVTVNGLLSVWGTSTFNSGNLDVKATGRLMSQNINFDNPNNKIAGEVNATGETRLHNGPTTFSGCGRLVTDTLILYNSNVLKGTGVVKILTVYNQSGWNLRPLTDVSTIKVNYLGVGTPYFASATLSTNASTPCESALAIKYKANSFNLIRVKKFFK